MESAACEVNNRDNTRPKTELGRTRWLFYPLSCLFSFRILGYYRPKASHKTKVVSFFFSHLFIGRSFLIKDKSILQEVGYFLIAWWRESLFLCVPNPSPPPFSLRVSALMLFPRGNPFWTHFLYCTSLLHPFLSREHCLVSAYIWVLFCSYLFCASIVSFTIFLFEVNFFFSTTF